MGRRCTVVLKSALFSTLILFGLAACADSITNIDDQPITRPNDPNNNIQSWAWVNDSCFMGVCYAKSKISHDTNVSLDGQSVEFTFKKNQPCSTNCYTNTYNFDRVIYGSAADSATSLTLDLYAALDSRGLKHSQALEFNVEQDVQIGSNLWARFIYGVQCDYKGSGLWRVWDGGISGGSWAATSTPCSPPTSADVFSHYVFDFTRIGPNQIEYNDFSIDGTDIVLDYLTHGVQTATDWHDQLVGAIQLDGDSRAHSYSAFVDRMTINYATVPEPSSLLLLSVGAIGLLGSLRKKLVP
jgi:PEP-CTERM motif